MQFKTTMSILFKPSRMAITNKTKQNNNKCWWETGTLTHGWECKMVQLLCKSLVGPQKVKHRITIWLSNSTPSVYTQENWKHTVNTKTWTQMFMAELFIIVKSTNNPNAHNQNVEYPCNKISFTIKRNVVIYAVTWMVCVNMQSEKSQIKKAMLNDSTYFV